MWRCLTTRDTQNILRGSARIHGIYKHQYLNKIPNIPRNNPVIFVFQMAMLQQSTAAFLLYIGKTVFAYFIAFQTYCYGTFL
jgi:hypothetical protein